MANGFHGSPDEWASLEGPLRALDSVLQAFADAHDIPLVKNERNWPDRSFRWGDSPELLIQIYLESPAGPTYTLWASASDHRSRADYWLHRTFIKAAPVSEIADGLEGLLAAAYEQAEAWQGSYESPD